MSEVTKNPKRDDDISSEEYENLLDKYQFSAKELSPGKREVLETVVRMNSARHLTSLFDDPAEKFYLFEALTDPSRYPWEEREEAPQGPRPRRQAAKQVR